MAEGHGEGSENQQADREWALQSEEAADMAGPQESFPAGHKHSLKWIPQNLSGTGVKV